MKRRSKGKRQEVVSAGPTVFIGQRFKDCSKSQVVYFKVQLTEQTMIIKNINLITLLMVKIATIY